MTGKSLVYVFMWGRDLDHWHFLEGVKFKANFSGHFFRLRPLPMIGKENLMHGKKKKIFMEEFWSEFCVWEKKTKKI